VDIAGASEWFAQGGTRLDWDGGGSDKALSYRNDTPAEIVKIFGKQGFIWGGRWFHYDTMHFEYRPELIELTK
jgi:hypothetical protein